MISDSALISRITPGVDLFGNRNPALRGPAHDEKTLGEVILIRVHIVAVPVVVNLGDVPALHRRLPRPPVGHRGARGRVVRVTDIRLRPHGRIVGHHPDVVGNGAWLRYRHVVLALGIIPYPRRYVSAETGHRGRGFEQCSVRRMERTPVPLSPVVLEFRGILSRPHAGILHAHLAVIAQPSVRILGNALGAVIPEHVPHLRPGLEPVVFLRPGRVRQAQEQRKKHSHRLDPGNLDHVEDLLRVGIHNWCIRYRLVLQNRIRIPTCVTRGSPTYRLRSWKSP